MAKEDYIDLQNKKRLVLTQSDIEFIRDNPHHLTIEGCKAYLNDWTNHSRNRYMQARYLAMLKKCKTFDKSGMLKDGRVVLSRDVEGKPRESAYLDTDYNRLSRKAWNALDEVKRITSV